MAYFVSYLEKEPCTKLCGVLISFHEVMKLQSFEFNVSDFIEQTGKIRSSFKIFQFGLQKEKTTSVLLG